MFMRKIGDKYVKNDMLIGYLYFGKKVKLYRILIVVFVVLRVKIQLFYFDFILNFLIYKLKDIELLKNV